MVQAPVAVDAAMRAADRPALRDLVAAGNPYLSYTYSYPHKTAYRPFAPRPLHEVWANEQRDALSLYFHVPFCEMRCGYCNLFTQVRAPDELQRRYVETVEEQAEQVLTALGDTQFARIAFGGGTPTQLDVSLLDRLFDVSERQLGASLESLPVSLETSPATATHEKLAAIDQRGIDRISIGIESFIDAELKALGRPLRAQVAVDALERIRGRDIPTLNIDLIYGIAGQTASSWLESLRMAMRYEPEELYLYPLYVRPLTGLGRRDQSWHDERLALYRTGRDFLLAAGYEQVSMRMFRARDAESEDGPVYCCQEDGMIGLGCGARSYTRDLHYSDEWAVGAHGVREILARWVDRPRRELAAAWYGYQLDTEDQRVRYAVKSLLRHEGLSRSDYQRFLGGEVMQELPRLQELVDLDLAVLDDERLVLSARGLELSDLVGPWLYSDAVRNLSGAFELR